MNPYMKKNAKAGALRHRALLLLVGVILASCLIIFGGARRTRQAQASDEQPTIGYTSVYVQPGDTLWDIAVTYMDSDVSDCADCVEEIRRINHMTGEDDLRAGSYIIVPVTLSEI